MPDREKVIKALACCVFPVSKGFPYQSHIADGGCEAVECPYRDDCDQMLLDALELLKGKESEWLEDSDQGQEYGTTWACRRCMHSIHKPYIWNPYDSGYKYCPHCGAEMKVKLDAEAD